MLHDEFLYDKSLNSHQSHIYYLDQENFHIYVVCFCIEFCQALSSRNSSCGIFMFFKRNIQNFSVTWNKINSSSNLLISYPLITQTQIKHMLPTSFMFRVNPYIKTILSKTRGNSRLKTRYLKGITTEQLFIIFILRYCLQSPLLFIQLLKEIKANQTNSFYFIFIVHLFFLIYKAN